MWETGEMRHDKAQILRPLFVDVKLVIRTGVWVSRYKIQRKIEKIHESEFAGATSLSSFHIAQSIRGIQLADKHNLNFKHIP